MNLVIRKADTGDLDFLEETEKECSGMPWNREQFEEELAFPLAHTYIAEAEGEPAGFFSMHVVADDAHLNEFAVRSGYRRLGIGMQLAEKMLEICRDNRCSVFSLEVRESAAPAVSLYEKIGFVKTGRRKGFYLNPKEDALIYIMNLEEDDPEC